MKAWALAEVLRKEIAGGVWPVGGRLPTEPDLARRHDIAINTVRRAVGLLVDEGLVDRRQGSGTYVRVRPDQTPGEAARVVGVLVPSTSYFYPRIITGIERVLSANGVNVMLASSDYRPDREAAHLRRFLDSAVDGLILVPNLHLMTDPQAYVESLRSLPVPYVLTERRPPAPAPDDPTNYVVTDHAAGVHTAINHLVKLGHRRIGCLGRVRTGSSAAVSEGFRQTCARLDLPVVPEAVVCHEVWTTEQIADFARRCRDHEVTAVFCHGDRDAASLLARAQALGLRVPHDLALVTYDDEVADIGNPPLTAVAPPKQAVGAASAELLLKLMADEAAPVHRMELQPQLVLRDSCGAREPAVAASP
ncbi:GntR family transcriptional regulator [Actinoplanes sp. LDG1-06]|uniref:GntR family transcriptional regulator n=1 Tax=Paractinoplanes ovalisporus TaxID=2810368 RepID=A0ABS2A5F8_9ACTN|nr:GntR family transcriptional regulator [Actinoplanes ovalisporus]MBM2615071.1 GntR family transcriptional regulator [Actinoplanes ovalisporus]